MLTKLKYIYHTMMSNYYLNLMDSLTCKSSDEYKKFQKRYCHHFTKRWENVEIRRNNR